MATDARDTDWSAAMTAAGLVSDEDPDRGLRRALMAIALVAVVAAVGVRVGGFYAEIGSSQPSVSVFGLLMLAAGVAGVTTWVVWRSRLRSRDEPDLSGVLTARQKRTVKRQVSGKEEVSASLLPLMLAYARQRRRRTPAELAWAIGFVAIATSFGSSGGVLSAVLYVLTGLFVLAVVTDVVYNHRLGRFLQQWGEEAPSSSKTIA